LNVANVSDKLRAIVAMVSQIADDLEATPAPVPTPAHELARVTVLRTSSADLDAQFA
jgi:hypothetical protein